MSWVAVGLSFLTTLGASSFPRLSRFSIYNFKRGASHRIASRRTVRGVCCVLCYVLRRAVALVVYDGGRAVAAILLYTGGLSSIIRTLM